MFTCIAIGLPAKSEHHGVIAHIVAGSICVGPKIGGHLHYEAICQDVQHTNKREDEDCPPAEELCEVHLV